MTCVASTVSARAVPLPIVLSTAGQLTIPPSGDVVVEPSPALLAPLDGSPLFPLPGAPLPPAPLVPLGDELPLALPPPLDAASSVPVLPVGLFDACGVEEVPHATSNERTASP